MRVFDFKRHHDKISHLISDTSPPINVDDDAYKVSSCRQLSHLRVYRNIECVSRPNDDCFNVLYDHFSCNRVHHFINYFKYIYINIFTFDTSRTHVFKRLIYIYVFYSLFTARINVIKSSLLKIKTNDRLLQFSIEMKGLKENSIEFIIFFFIYNFFYQLST